MEVLTTTETTFALALTKTTTVGPALTSLGSMTQWLYITSLTSTTTSSTVVTPTMVAASSRGHDAGR
jgi:hypothetical protein